LFIHGPLQLKAIFEEMFFKGKGGGFNYNFGKSYLEG